MLPLSIEKPHMKTEDLLFLGMGQLLVAAFFLIVQAMKRWK
jgi:hypothetical protein